MALRKTAYLQTQKYSADDDRYAEAFGALQAGVFDPNDFKVNAQGPAAMAVDILAGRALVAGGYAPNPYQGNYFQANDATMSRAITANSSGLPRIDQVLLVVNDSANGGASDIPDIIVVPGTPTTGAQSTDHQAANYRAGAVVDATLTTTYRNCLRLADVQVDNGAVSIAQAKIMDRRRWARGYSNVATATTLNPTVTATTLGTAVLVPEMVLLGEFSGAPVEVFFSSFGVNSGAGNYTVYFPTLDDAALPNQTTADGLDEGTRLCYAPAASAGAPVSGSYRFTPPAGRHKINLKSYVTAGTGTHSRYRRQLEVREVIQQTAGN